MVTPLGGVGFTFSLQQAQRLHISYVPHRFVIDLSVQSIFSSKMKSETVLDALPILCCRLLYDADRIKRNILPCQYKSNILIGLEVASPNFLPFRRAGALKFHLYIY